MNVLGSGFKTTVLLFSLLLFTTGITAQSTPEKWHNMFNGEDLSGWTVKIHHYEVGDNHGDTFRVKDSIIQVRYDKYEGEFDERYGHLYYDQPYSHYRLKLEYRFVGELHPGAPVFTIKNSGLMFHSQDPRSMPKEQDWPISVEMQFLAGLEQGKSRPTGNMCSPGTDVFYKGKKDPRHCISSSSETYFGDQWVRAELIVRGDSVVTHKINGKTVLEYTRPQIGGGVVHRYDPTVKLDGKLLKEGYIALQSEGQPIDFRNIKIQNLKGCMDPKALNYSKHFIASDPERCEY